ncbi:amidohydrolase [Bacillus sp. sid0103]|uniref:amidohydrolase n=1 Tax=Bacillus sp. sid0103 TaxID=2856337 RepID=UPI001C47E1C4|nr:amidohydrolase [Bacillus sp. sid0103]MBV7507930.1 amidohydrolase [Bacillus sp. sid0103]
MSQLIDFINGQEQAILKTYVDLHQLAEPSWQEHKTSHFIKAVLTEAEIPFKTYEGHFGIVADIPGEGNEIVALRADMDALLQEVKGKVQPNHSCGHDAHSTMVLHTALAFAACKPYRSKPVRFIFQPAEEKGEGALQMMQEGALDGVHYLFGVHLRPWDEVPMGKVAPAIVHSSCATIYGVIKGKQAHASRPQDGNNPIEAASYLIQALQNIRLKNQDSFSIKMTGLHAGGGSSNVIPETANYILDLRATTNEAMDELQSRALDLLEKVGALTGTSISGTVKEFVPAARLNKEAIKLAMDAVAVVMGEENVDDNCISQGGEDFHFYTLQNPKLKATMLGLGCDLRPGLHHPDMQFNQKALLYGTKILTSLLYNAASINKSVI